MTIRKTLLLAFLLVGVTPAVALAVLGFESARRAVQAEIEQGLTAQADALLSDVTKLMYERLQNAATWRRIEVMQDLQVGDVDKRLSAFLQRLAVGYGGLYRDLSAVDPQGRVVASSDPARLGERVAASPVWQRVTLGDTTVTLCEPDQPGPMPGPATAGAGSLLALRTPIPSAFGAGDLGELQLRFDWTQVDQLLDAAAGGSRMVALLDRQGRVVAGSKRLLAALPRMGGDLADWAQPAASAPRVVTARAPLPEQPMLAGTARPRGFAGFEGFGWSVVVLVPRDEALAPVRSMALILGALLAAVVAMTLVGSGLVSQAIARPIVALTAFSRNYRHGRALPPPPGGRGSEVGELRDAFAGMVQDIERSQQELARASALAAVGEMSAVIAHEVRTPLGIVLSSAQVLRREAGLSDEGRELVGFIESETSRLGRLVNSMLESTRPRAPVPAPTDLGALIVHVVGLLSAQAARQGVQVETRLQAADPTVECDAEQMTQVLLNLIVNALQILAQGGRVVVSTRDDGDHLVVEIADDGPGIAPDARQRIFEAFHFQREGGIGLGLAVVQRIVAAHRGQVEAADSELGGALFRVRLPRKEPVPS